MTSHCVHCLRKFEMTANGQEFCTPEHAARFRADLAYHEKVVRKGLRIGVQSSGLPQIAGWTIPLQNSDHSQDNR